MKEIYKRIALKLLPLDFKPSIRKADYKKLSKHYNEMLDLLETLHGISSDYYDEIYREWSQENGA